MTKQSKKSGKIERNTSKIIPLISNMYAVFSHRDVIMLDFGFVAPSYDEPHDVEDTQIARVCLTWETAEGVLKLLQDAIIEHKKEKEANPDQG